MKVILSNNPENTTPGLKSLFDLSNGQDVGADLSGDSG